MNARGRTTFGTGCVAITLLVGCATQTSPDAASPSAASSSGVSPQSESKAPATGRELLRELADAELGLPDAASERMPPPVGLTASVVAPLDEAATATARIPLADVVSQRSSEPVVDMLPIPTDDEASGLSTTDRGLALSLYASARQRLARGDSAGASRELERAARLDPSSSQIWRELGEAQIGSGDLAAGLASFRQALRRGAASPKVHITLGRAALLQRDFELAANHYADALQQRGTDPATTIVAQAGLGEALLETGELAAAIDALSTALALPPRVNGPTLYQGILTETFRRRTDLLRQAGDAAMRLGDPALADNVYADAAAGPSFDPGAILVRRVHAVMRQGRPAAAALLVVESIDEAQGRVDDRAQSLIRHLASLDQIGDALAGAISEVERSLPQPVPPSVASTLARASAEAAGPTRRVAILREHLNRFPTDEAVLALLLDDASSADEAFGRAARHVAAHPAFANVAAAALAGTRFRMEDLLAASETTATPARVVRGELLLADGDPARAWQEVSLIATGVNTSDLSMLVSIVRIAAAAGQWADVDASLAALATAAEADPTLRWHLARAQRSAQRFPQALETLSFVVDTSSDDDATRTGPLVDAAELSLSAGQPNRADSYLRRVLAVDPRDDRAYRGLISLYGPDAPLADPNQLATIIRSLRQANPSSPLLRWLNAQDLARAGRLDAAERALSDLAEQDPRSPELIELLLRVWIQKSPLNDGASLARGEAWVRAKLDEFPDDRTLTAALARVLVAIDRADDAVTVLRDRLAARPDAQLANLLDSILRQALEDPEAADAALADGLVQGSAGIDQTLRRALALARLERFDEISPVLEEGLPRGIVHTASQRAAAGGLFAQLARSANDNPEALAAAADVFDHIESAGIVLPAEAHTLRFDVLARLPAEVARIRAAADALAALAPQQATQAYAAAAARLAQRQRAGDARALLRQAASDRRGGAAFASLTAEWYRAEVLTGTRATMLELVNEALADDQTEAVVATFGGREPDADATLRRAEVAYITGQILSQINRPADAEALYRAALGLHPKHAWAANNLGYAMAERGENLDEAEALLEMAHIERPGETSITDSLGWVRYRRGVIFDETRADGTIRQGALTLLREAVEIGGDAASPEIFEHLGDAAWVAGEQAEATAAYERATRLLDRARSDAKAADQPDEGEVRRLETERRRIETKAQLARTGRPPGVTRHEPANLPQPPATAPTDEPVDTSIDTPSDTPDTTPTDGPSE